MTRNGGRDESTTQVIPEWAAQERRREDTPAPEAGGGAERDRPTPAHAREQEPQPPDTQQEPTRTRDGRAQTGAVPEGTEAPAATVIPGHQGEQVEHRSEQRGERGRVRRARLRAVRLDPWSVMKTSFLLSIAAGIMIVVAIGVIWKVLDTAGVYEAVNRTIADVLGGASNADFDVNDYIGFKRVLGFASLLAVVDVVLVTAIATLGAFLYNLSAALLGGIEVTLAEDE